MSGKILGIIKLFNDTKGVSAHDAFLILFNDYCYVESSIHYSFHDDYYIINTNDYLTHNH